MKMKNKLNVKSTGNAIYTHLIQSTRESSNCNKKTSSHSPTKPRRTVHGVLLVRFLAGCKALQSPL